ncbi:hypothetical protein PMIN01_10970 [Paraphaeosphaeria minitans]|uniref:Uncharacterized protein n=1 Tax=Paraphaeosphaeria minitans TaxID=565426 RepID=A0A9P6G8F4_9PLEO|nr:hypothetical protein PMIN01_10970 [Paraphaeosphaeria minitans]
MGRTTEWTGVMFRGMNLFLSSFFVSPRWRRREPRGWTWARAVFVDVPFVGSRSCGDVVEAPPARDGSLRYADGVNGAATLAPTVWNLPSTARAPPHLSGFAGRAIREPGFPAVRVMFVDLDARLDINPRNTGPVRDGDAARIECIRFQPRQARNARKPAHVTEAAMGRAEREANT